MKIGIVGLPNVGKSTLFNSITKAGAECANYPFCTIEPNVGIVAVPDERLDKLTEMYHPQKTTHAVVEFVDIAGLVKGASKGEGLGNKFLSHIRETDAIAEVVRCFDDENIVHVDGSVDPIRDIETINLELIFADIETVDKRLDKAKTMSELNSLKAEFDDYYGNLPEAILTLIEKRKLEILSHYSIIEDIKDSGKQLEIIFSPNAFETISGDKLFLLANQLFTKPAFKSLDNKITIKINKHDQWLNRLNEFIETLSKK